MRLLLCVWTHSRARRGLTLGLSPFILMANMLAAQSNGGNEPLKTAKGVRELLMARLQNMSPGCAQNLPPAKDLIVTLQKVKDFWDVSGAGGEFTQDSMVQNGSRIKLKDTDFQAKAFTLTALGTIYPLIFLRPNFFTDVHSRSDQQDTLLHELLHIHFNLGDTELCHHFGLECDRSDSAKLTDWIGRDCRQANSGGRK